MPVLHQISSDSNICKKQSQKQELTYLQKANPLAKKIFQSGESSFEQSSCYAKYRLKEERYH
jgi:hypothetical protein